MPPNVVISLRRRWGIVDVQDCCNAARDLVSLGLVDPKRLCISGGSAGGYTTLACLAFRLVACNWGCRSPPWFFASPTLALLPQMCHGGKTQLKPLGRGCRARALLLHRAPKAGHG
jgi:hypothetical protein